MSEYHSSKLLPRISTQGLSPTAERPGELQHGPGVVSSLHLQALSPHRQTGLVPFSLFFFASLHRCKNHTDIHSRTFSTA